MMASSHNLYKNVVLNAWKERWSEQKWTTTMRKLLQSGNTGDMLHMADVLFTQAFIGSTPNTVLLSYFNYGLKSGTLCYAAIFTAVAKHEDLHNITNMNYTLTFLMRYIKKLNKGQVLEDSMSLCKALLLILQWLLRNIEQYLRGVHGVSSADSEMIIRNNCATLHSLTILQRTSSLLTIARFEESSGWSRIETDLAVIKNAAVGHCTHNDVTMSCGSVSQLARCHTQTSAVYRMPKLRGNESHHSMLVNMMVLLEVEWNKMTDPDTLIQQLFLIAQLCELDTKELCLDLIRACMMGFSGNINGKMKHKWSSVLFLSLPQHLTHFKSALSCENGSEISIPLNEPDFETAVASAFGELLQYDSLLDMLDQVAGNSDCYSWLVDRCVTYQVLKEPAAENLKLQRASMQKVLSQHPAHAFEPSKLVKYESTTRKLLSLLGTSDYISKQENLLTTLSQLSSNFSIILASGPAAHNVRNFAQKLIFFNDAVRSSQAESVKSAQIRCLLFDFTFFLVCQIAEEYGKNIILGSIGDVGNSKPFLYNWIASYWPEDRWPAFGNVDSSAKLEVEDGRVRVYIEFLQSKRERTQEQSLSLKKWHDICTNMSKAFLEMVRAWHYKVISKADVLGACDIICNTLSLAVRLSCLLEIAKYATSVPNEFAKDLQDVFQNMMSAPSSSGQDLFNIDKRFSMFKNTAEFLLSDTNPEIFRGGNTNFTSSELAEYPADVFSDLMAECRQVGWIDSDMLHRLSVLLKRSGAKWMCHQFVSQLLRQTRKDLVEKTATVIGGLLFLDIESFAICLLRHEIPHYLTDESDHMLLSAPAGNVLAQLAVSCLAMVLHNISLQQKECLPPKTQKERLTHQQLLSGIEAPLPHHNQLPDNGGPTKLRRLFSITAEHDLASGAFTSILGGARDSNATQSRYPCVTEPVLRALSYALDLMHMSLTERQPGPHIDFAVYFVYLASRCGELVSQAVLKLMPLSMVTELSALINARDSTFKVSKFGKEFDSFNFALCVSDLGHQLSRKIAAKAICQIVLRD